MRRLLVLAAIGGAAALGAELARSISEFAAPLSLRDRLGLGFLLAILGYFALALGLDLYFRIDSGLGA
mgnify:CR=1 FL=1